MRTVDGLENIIEAFGVVGMGKSLFSVCLFVQPRVLQISELGLNLVLDEAVKLLSSRLSLCYTVQKPLDLLVIFFEQALEVP